MVNPELAYIPNLKHWYAYQIVYPLSLALVKASFLALYYRVFPPPNMNRVMFWGRQRFHRCVHCRYYHGQRKQ